MLVWWRVEDGVDGSEELDMFSAFCLVLYKSNVSEYCKGWKDGDDRARMGEAC